MKNLKSLKKQYLKILKPAPVLNTPNFKDVFDRYNKNNIKKEEKGHIRALEFIAFKDMHFEIIKKTLFPHIFQVKSDFYVSETLFIDERFTKMIQIKPILKKTLKIEKKEILQRLSSFLGLKYLWGGNYSRGIDDLIKFYYKDYLFKNEDHKSTSILKGMDCSGILYEATDGFTPRNTSDLLHYKTNLEIENLNSSQIASLLKPLDLIVFKGHVVIVFDDNHCIESRENLGVVKTITKQRLKELLSDKKPSNEYSEDNEFVVRRWI